MIDLVSVGLALATLSYMIAYLSGPLGVFQIVRDVFKHEGNPPRLSVAGLFDRAHAHIYNGITCPFCIAFWLWLIYTFNATPRHSINMETLVFTLSQLGAAYVIIALLNTAKAAAEAAHTYSRASSYLTGNYGDDIELHG